MLDLAKAFFLIPVYLLIFLILGCLVLRVLKGKFSFSLAVISGFFAYHFLFSLIALPCILTQQTLSALMLLWLPLLGALVVCSAWLCRHMLLCGTKSLIKNLKSDLHTPARLILPFIAAACVLLLLYLSVCSYYMGWDTVFYTRTVLEAVEHDSMYTLEAASGKTASSLSLRYALSPFYMNSAIFCRLLKLHPLILQNITDGSICVLLAFLIIFRTAMLIFDGDRGKACLAVIFAAVIHVSHASLFSASEFLLLRSFEAKACCANIILPFIVCCEIDLWKNPDSRTGCGLLFLCAAAANPISMSSLLTVPFLLTAFCPVWIVKHNLKAFRQSLVCLIPCILFIGAYLLEYTGLLVIPIR